MIKKLLLMALAATMVFACKPENANVDNTDDNNDPVPEVKPKHVDEYVANTTTLEGQWRDSVHTALAKAFKEEKIVMGQYTMPIWWTIFGNKPSDGRSLYISLHGGGGTTAAQNNSQWNNQKKLYQPAEGVYLCPRAITNTWDLHFRPESDAFYEEIERAAWTYLSDRLSIPTAELNKDNIASLLAQKGVDESLIAAVKDVLSTAEFARYAPSTDHAMEDLYRATTNMINNLEEEKL